MNITCLIKGSEFFATVPMEVLSVGTVRHANTDNPSSSAKVPSFASLSWWCSLSKKNIPVAYWAKGGNSTFCSFLYVTAKHNSSIIDHKVAYIATVCFKNGFFSRPIQFYYSELLDILVFIDLKIKIGTQIIFYL